MADVHIYNNINNQKINTILNELKKSGAVVSGSNPWDVDTKQHGVKLRGTWNEARSTLSVEVTAKNWYVPDVWNTIDKMFK